MALGTSNRDGGKTSESGHLRALSKAFTGDVFQGLQVTQRAAGVNMSVDLAVGDTLIRRSDNTYAHPCWNDEALNVVIGAADPSNPRRDLIVMYVDYNEDPDPDVSNNTNGVVKVKVVAGTAAGSPADPNGAAVQASVGSGNPYTILARARVGAGVTSLANAVIDDLRVMASPVIADRYITSEKLAIGAALTNPYKFSAYHDTTQSLSTGSKVSFNTELYDTNNNFASSRYTAPVAGFYAFTANIFMQSTPSYGVIELWKNGAFLMRGSSGNEAGQDGSWGITPPLLQLEANDYIEIYVAFNGGGSKTIYASAGERFVWFGGYLASL